MTRLRSLVGVLLVLVAGGTLLGGPATAQVVVPPPTDSGGDSGGLEPVVETSLGGYEGRAITSGVHAFYNPAGVLPTAPPLDAGSPDALATISAGPSTYARAAAFDPGDLLANPEALLQQASPDYPAGTIPAWPLRIEANSSLGEPRAESNPAPGMTAFVEARSEGSRARSTAPAAILPGVISVGSVASESWTKLESDEVSVRARTEISGFRLLDLITIESIVTDVTATSDGTKTTTSGGTTIVGATFMDRPVIIDADGVRADPAAAEGEAPAGPAIPGLNTVLEPLQAPLGELLAGAGIKLSLLGPVQQGGGKAGQLSTTGLRIDLEVSDTTFPQLHELLDLLPEIPALAPDAPSPADVIEVLKARHLVALELGRAQVALSATVETPFDESAFDVAGDVGVTGDLSLAPFPTPTFDSSIGNDGTGGESVAALPTTKPVGSVSAGIGALALLALLVQPFLGDRLARAASAVLGEGGADVCLREKR